jgi:hypothetical protein
MREINIFSDQAKTLRSLFSLEEKSDQFYCKTLFVLNQNDVLKNNIEKFFKLKIQGEMLFLSVEDVLKKRQNIDSFDIHVGVLTSDKKDIFDIYSALKILKKMYPYKKRCVLSYKSTDILYDKINKVWSEFVDDKLYFLGSFYGVKNSIHWDIFDIYK